MPFKLMVTRTVNGIPRTVWLQLAEGNRAQVEQVITDFESGRLAMEGTLTLSTGDPAAPSWMQSCRWIDVKRLWIEEV
jgi:hypothetical protein